MTYELSTCQIYMLLYSLGQHNWHPFIVGFFVFFAISSEINGKEPNLYQLVLSFSILYQLSCHKIKAILQDFFSRRYST